MKKLYATGFTNYATHNEGKIAFADLNAPAALELQRGGNAVIVWLTTITTQPGQAPFTGTQPIYNTAAEALRT